MQQDQREMVASILGTKQPGARKRRGFADRCNVADIGRILIAETASLGRAGKGKIKTDCNLRDCEEDEGVRLKPSCSCLIAPVCACGSLIARAACGNIPLHTDGSGGKIVANRPRSFMKQQAEPGVMHSLSQSFGIVRAFRCSHEDVPAARGFA